MVGEEHVELTGVPLELGELAHPLQVRRPLHIQVAVGRPVEQAAGPERRRYAITEVGAADVERWLAEPVPPEPDLQSDLFAKVVLALMLDRPADTYLDAQRAAHLQRMRELTDLKHGSDPLGVLLADHALYRLEADLRWIDHTAARLDMIERAVRQ